MQKTLGALVAAATFTFLTVAPAVAQTSAAAPAVVKVLLQNADVGVNRFTYAPGAVSVTSKRPHRFVYVLAGPAKFKLTYADGHTKMESGKTGDAWWEEPGTVSVTNVGSDTVQVLSVNVRK
jgi:quercetin dioxygenase-like cupin family protein